MSGPWVKDKGSVWHTDPLIAEFLRRSTVQVMDKPFVSITRCGQIVLYGLRWDTMSWSETASWIRGSGLPICEECG